MGYILFSSEEFVSIEHVHYIGNLRKWNGIIEYSYDNKKWHIWNGEQIINNKIYMRGINNTVVSDGNPWIINGKNITCQGNIENLLDYKSVINNVHPKMEAYCFAYMFSGCHSLIEMPQLLSSVLAKGCYYRMFFGCDNLSILPPLLAIDLAENCYWRMFEKCCLLTVSSLFLTANVAKEAIINQQMFTSCPIQQININNKLYDINVLKLF